MTLVPNLKGAERAFAIGVHVVDFVVSVSRTHNLKNVRREREESLADFEPDAIVEKVPELKSILELREALKSLKGPLGNVPDFRKKLQALVSDEGSRAKLLAELGLDKK
jgi:type VI secretion system ImpB/VipA family protein